MWYYTLDGQQAGPVSQTELAQMLNGTLPSNTLVWKDGMTDWLPAENVEAFRNIEDSLQNSADTAVINPSPTNDTNPYAAPNTVAYHTPEVRDADQIPVEPIPLKVGFCFQQAIRHTNANFGKIFLMSITFGGIIVALTLLFTVLSSAIDGPQAGISPEIQAFDESSDFMNTMTVEPKGPVGKITDFIMGVIQTFLTIGGIAFMLSIARGQDASISQLFSQGAGKVFKVYIANILYALAVGIGFILLVVPGIYIMLRYMFFMHAIVDKNLGIIESLNYSAELTRDNKLNLLGLILLIILTVIGGAIALLVGLFWALPVTYLAISITYLYLHGGERSISVRS